MHRPELGTGMTWGRSNTTIIHFGSPAGTSYDEEKEEPPTPAKTRWDWWLGRWK